MRITLTARLGAACLLACGPAAWAVEAGLAPEPDVSIKSHAGHVSAAVRQADGKWLVSGNFTRADGVERRGVARLHPDGSLDESFRLACSSICNVAAILPLADGSIILGGFFDTVETAIVNGIAKVRSDGSLIADWRPDILQEAFTSRVDAFALTNDGLMVAGRFLGFGGTQRPHLARIDPYGTGAIDPDYDASATVTQYPGAVALLASGEAFVANPSLTVKLARLSANGTRSVAFSDAAVAGEAKVLAYDAARDRLYVGGPLDGTADGVDAVTAQLGRLAGSTGAFDTGWIPADDEALPHDLLVDDDGTIVVASGWSSPDHIRVLDPDDASLASGFGPSGTNDLGFLIDRPGPGFLVANFLRFTGAQTALGDVTPAGAIAPGFDPDLGNDVFLTRAARGADGTLHLLGNFFFVDGASRPGLARLLPDGSLDPAFVPPLTFANDVVVTPEGVFVSGFFDFVDGQARQGFAKLDAVTGALRPWTLAQTDTGDARVFPAAAGHLHVAAEFDATLCGAPQAGNLARVGTGEPCVRDAVFQPDVDGLVRAMVDDGTTHLYLAGSFTAVGGQPRAGLARVDRITGALDATWVPPPAAAMYDVSAVALGADHLYFVGHRHSDFGATNGLQVLRVARSNAAFETFGPAFGGAIASLQVGAGNDRHLYVGGRFEQVGVVSQRLLARLALDSGEVDPDFAPQVEGAVVNDLETTADVVLFAGSLHRVDGEARKRVAAYGVASDVILRNGFE